MSGREPAAGHSPFEWEQLPDAGDEEGQRALAQALDPVARSIRVKGWSRLEEREKPHALRDRLHELARDEPFRYLGAVQRLGSALEALDEGPPQERPG